mmetsp:Transcript_4078/g.7157  ORF Transcript_4078/g.7157 Transcript_4078/m.7157 type:complete len:349 (-) Transcript_4078:322-1368(-)
MLEQEQQQVLYGTYEAQTNLIARPEALAHFQAQREHHEKTEKHNKENVSHVANHSEKQSSLHSRGNSRDKPTGFFSKMFCFSTELTSEQNPDARRQSFNTNHEPQRNVDESKTHLSSATQKKFQWDALTEYTILACIEHLDTNGVQEPRLFAVSADQDDVDMLRVETGVPLKEDMDLHVAAATIKDRMRHADSPFIPISAVQTWIASQVQAQEAEMKAHLRVDDPNRLTQSTNSAEEMESIYIAKTTSFAESNLKKILDHIKHSVSEQRAKLVSRFFLLLGDIAARISITQMNSHNLALCLTPSMLQWDTHASQALLVLARMTAFVMEMIDDARLFSESLRKYHNALM